MKPCVCLVTFTGPLNSVVKSNQTKACWRFHFRLGTFFNLVASFRLDFDREKRTRMHLKIMQQTPCMKSLEGSVSFVYQLVILSIKIWKKLQQIIITHGRIIWVGQRPGILICTWRLCALRRPSGSGLLTTQLFFSFTFQMKMVNWGLIVCPSESL